MNPNYFAFYNPTAPRNKFRMFRRWRAMCARAKRLAMPTLFVLSGTICFIVGWYAHKQPVNIYRDVEPRPLFHDTVVLPDFDELPCEKQEQLTSI